MSVFNVCDDNDYDDDDNDDDDEDGGKLFGFLWPLPEDITEVL